MTSRAGSWETCFFGPAERQLVGCHHPPRPDRDRGCGVVLIHSLGEEYVKFHRALRQLAVLLSQAGFSVLRFDLSCSGDSWGGCEEGEVDLWLQDIEDAVCELQRSHDPRRLCLIGLRLGGALAVRAGMDRGDVDTLVLWDPVVDGKAYLSELASLHASMLSYAHVKPDPSPAGGEYSEILGHPLSTTTRTSVAAVDLLALEERPARSVLVVESNPRVPQHDLTRHLEHLHVDVAYRSLPAPEIWAWLEDFGKVLVPHRVLQTVVSWMDEVHP